MILRVGDKVKTNDLAGALKNLDGIIHHFDVPIDEVDKDTDPGRIAYVDLYKKGSVYIKQRALYIAKLDKVEEQDAPVSRLLVGRAYYGMFDLSAKNTIQSYVASLEGKDGSK